MKDTGTLDKIKGKAEEVAGKVTGDNELKTKGVLDKAKGMMKETSEKVKEVSEEVVEKVKEKIEK